MKLIDFDSGNELDQVLLNCCQLIFKKHHQDGDYWGKVAACVIDGDGNKVYGVNHLTKEGTRIHAERAAINNYIKKFNEEPSDATIVTTLSPCNRDLEERWGDSCTNLLNEIGITDVYCGYRDPNENQENNQFQLKTTKNPKLKLLCKKIADTFLEKEKTITELDKSKQYKKPIGMMEMFKFMQIATSEQIHELKKLIANGEQERAWKFLQQVTGSNL